MAESITKRINAASMSGSSEREMRALMASMLTDLTALKTSINQLITDYNANTTIDDDTTAAAVSLNTTA
jgi:hypothetical protein